MTNQSTELTEMLAQIAELTAQSAPLLAQIADLKAGVKNAMFREQLTVATAPGIAAEFKPGYIRPVWNNEGLQEFAVDHPEILAHYKETEVAPTIAYRVQK